VARCHRKCQKNEAFSQAFERKIPCAGRGPLIGAAVQRRRGGGEGRGGGWGGEGKRQNKEGGGKAKKKKNREGEKKKKNPRAVTGHADGK